MTTSHVYNEAFADHISSLCIDQYNRLPKTGKPNVNESQWTLLSGICLEDDGKLSVVALATGTKCLGVTSYSTRGDVLHDSHAEVLTRRAWLRYLYSQMNLTLTGQASRVFNPAPTDIVDSYQKSLADQKSLDIELKFSLKPGVKFHFYTSHTPCGDASIFPRQIKAKTLAKIQSQAKRFKMEKDFLKRRKAASLDGPMREEDVLKRKKAPSFEGKNGEENGVITSEAREPKKVKVEPASLDEQNGEEYGGSTSEERAPQKTPADEIPSAETSINKVQVSVQKNLEDDKPSTDNSTTHNEQVSTAQKTPEDKKPSHKKETQDKTLEENSFAKNSTPQAQITGPFSPSTIPDWDSSSEDSGPDSLSGDVGSMVEDFHRTGAKILPDASRQDPKQAGRGFHLTGVVRTKPGRGDPTYSMSCSDKIARWNAVGWQGSLLSSLLSSPLHMSSITVGGGIAFSPAALERALLTRVTHLLPSPPPALLHAKVVFPAGKRSVKREMKRRGRPISSAHPVGGSIIWCNATYRPLEIAIEGIKQGVSRMRHNQNSSRSTLLVSPCKLLLQFIRLTRSARYLNQPYCEVKRQATEYRARLDKVKQALGQWLDAPQEYRQFCVRRMDEAL